MKTDELVFTRYKAKLPKNWSYPIGLEIISKAIKNIQFTDKVGLGFFWESDWPHSKFQQTVKDLGELDLFRYTGTYSPDYPSFLIYAVPSKIKSDVREALETDILPQFVEWLSNNNENKYFHVYLNLKNIKLRVECE